MTEDSPKSNLPVLRKTANKFMGGQTSYTEDLGIEICLQVMQGMTIEEVCAANPHYPSPNTIRCWDFYGRHGIEMQSNGFSEMYAQALEIRAEVELDIYKKICSTPRLAKITKIKETVNPKTGKIVELRETIIGDDVNARRLEAEALWRRIQTIGWARWGPRAPRQPDDVGDNTIAPKLIIEGGLPDDGHRPPNQGQTIDGIAE